MLAMTDNIINSTNSQKISVYCKTCICKSCEQVAWLEPENIELKAENERLKEELATYGATGVCEVCSDKANKLADKYLGCLQEIKAIADAKCNECKYGKDGISCKYGDCGEAKLHLITQLITKAEEE